MNKKQAGFTLVEILLMLVVLVLAVFTGFYVLNNKDDDTQVSTSSTRSTPTAAANDEFKDWKSYNADQAGFSLKYPSNWSTDICSYDDSGAILMGPNARQASKCQTDGTAQVIFTSETGDKTAQQISQEDYPDTKTESITVDGIKGAVTSGTLQTKEQILIGPTNGTKIKIYQFYTNGRTYKAEYTQTPEYSDELKTFDNIVTKTLKFD